MLSIAAALCVCSSRLFAYEPTEEAVSAHRLAVFEHAQDFIIETFNLQLEGKSSFQPVRFNARGVWGNFEARLKELGNDKFEVQGWLVSKAIPDERLTWSVIVVFPIEDPDAWKYRRIDLNHELKPRFVSWRFGPYRSLLSASGDATGFLRTRGKLPVVVASH